MDLWLPLISAVAGALIGMLATFLADRARSSRDRTDRDLSDRRSAYATYLAALAKSRNELHIAARSREVDLATRASRARAALATGEAYERRYQVSLIAPPRVIQASSHVIRVMREFRDAIQKGIFTMTASIRRYAIATTRDLRN
jgi:hypothetical protein